MTAEHAGLKLYITVNFYDDNQPGEVFIIASKQGSFIQTAFDRIAEMASYMLQHNIPVSWLCGESGKWRHHRVDPMIHTLNVKGEPTGGSHSIYDTLSDAIMHACSVFGANPSQGCLPPTPLPEPTNGTQVPCNPPSTIQSSTPPTV